MAGKAKSSKMKSSSSSNKGEKYPYPSFYGSHVSMVDEAKTAELGDPKLVVCKDEHGEYITERKRLDDGLADPNRYRGDRIPT